MPWSHESSTYLKWNMIQIMTFPEIRIWTYHYDKPLFNFIQHTTIQILRSSSKLKNFGENNNFRLMGFPMSDLTWSSLVLNLKVAFNLLTFSNFWTLPAETYPLSWSEYSPWHHHPQPIGLLARDLWVFKACCKIFWWWDFGMLTRWSRADSFAGIWCWSVQTASKTADCFENWFLN